MIILMFIPNNIRVLLCFVFTYFRPTGGTGKRWQNTKSVLKHSTARTGMISEHWKMQLWTSWTKQNRHLPRIEAEAETESGTA